MPENEQVNIEDCFEGTYIEDESLPTILAGRWQHIQFEAQRRQWGATDIATMMRHRVHIDDKDRIINIANGLIFRCNFCGKRLPKKYKKTKGYDFCNNCYSVYKLLNNEMKSKNQGIWKIYEFICRGELEECHSKNK